MKLNRAKEPKQPKCIGEFYCTQSTLYCENLIYPPPRPIF